MVEASPRKTKRKTDMGYEFQVGIDDRHGHMKEPKSTRISRVAIEHAVMTTL
jgi:hypothetical protein